MTPRSPIIDLITGIFIVLFINLMIIILSFLLLSLVGVYASILVNAIVIVGIGAIGLTQLLYVIPWAKKLYNSQQFERMKGVIIGAVITALLNGGCWIAFQLAFQPG